MATNTVQVTLDESTVTDLSRSQYFLYGLQGVQSSDAATMPLIWLQTQNYSENLTVTSSSEYEAYTSKSVIETGQQVDAGFTAALSVGDLLTVTQESGIGTVTTDGTSGTISVLNATSDQFTCGISINGNLSGFGPACATPLYGNGLQLVVPVAKTLLLFSTMPMPPGTAIATAPNQGLLIDQTDAPSDVTVAFDINTGWDAGQKPYAQVIPARTNLAPLITEYSQELASMAAELVNRLTDKARPPR